MALNAYLWVEGASQGKIDGSGTGDGREDMIEVNAVYHEVSTPSEGRTGIISSRRQHAPLTIVKAIDKSTPKLFSVLVNNENLSVFRLEFWRPTQDGIVSQFYTIELNDARISGIRTEMLHNKYPENANHLEYERVSFAYHGIVVTWQDGDISAEDTWQTQA